MRERLQTGMQQTFNALKADIEFCLLLFFRDKDCYLSPIGRISCRRGASRPCKPTTMVAVVA